MNCKTLATIALFPLSACNSAPTLWPISPPANMTQPCPELTDAKPQTLGELLAADIELIGMYRDCKERHNALAEWLI